MAKAMYLTQAIGKAMLDVLVDTIDVTSAGTLKIYDGTKAVTANTATSGQNLLATLTFTATAFGAATTADPSVATAAGITSDTSADATFTATWARIANGTPTTCFDLSVGTVAAGTEDIQLNTTAIVTGATVALTAMTVTMPLHP